MKEIIIEFAEWFFIIGSMMSIAVGVFLYLKPELYGSLNLSLNKWYSSRKSLKPLEIMRETDSKVFHYNKVWGWVMLLGSAIFLFYYFTMPFPSGALQFLIPDLRGAVLIEAVIESIWIFLAVFIIGGIPVWILLIYYPDSLKKVNQYFNRWLSTRMAMLPLEKMYFRVDSFVLKYHRAFGVIFVSGALFILFSIVYLY
ncbi:MAG: hypothetical protein ACE5EE_02040 [Fidelibacterota bacterium]